MSSDAIRQSGKPKNRTKTKYFFELLAIEERVLLNDVTTGTESNSTRTSKFNNQNDALVLSANSPKKGELPSSPVRENNSNFDNRKDIEVDTTAVKHEILARQSGDEQADEGVRNHIGGNGTKTDTIVKDSNGGIHKSYSKNGLSKKVEAPTNRIQKMLQSAARSKPPTNKSPLKAVMFSSDGSEIDTTYTVSSPITERIKPISVTQKNDKSVRNHFLPDLLGSSSTGKAPSSAPLILSDVDVGMPSRIPSDFPTDKIFGAEDVHIPFIPLDTFDNAYRELSSSDIPVEPYSTNELLFHTYCLLSDHYLQEAHSLPLGCEESIEKYYKLVQVSIVSLRILLEKHAHILTPTWELLVNYKLAKLYMNETTNVDLAEDCINKSTTIAARNKLLQLQFVGEYYYLTILESGNTKVFTNYINEKIAYYTNLKLYCFANLFKLKKVQSMLLDNTNTGIAILQTISKDDTLDASTSVVCLLYLASLKLYRGSSKSAQGILKEADKLIVQSANNVPSQLKAMHDILKLHCLIQLNSKDVLSHASKMMTAVNGSLTFRTWKQDGSFLISLPVNIEGQIQQGEFSYKVQWLSPIEYIVMTYYLCGIMLLAFRQPTPFFHNALSLIEKLKLELTDSLGNKLSRLSLEQSNGLFIRYNYIMYSINYYQVWERFLTNDYSNIDELNTFMVNYNEGKFSGEELCCYELLLPKILYLIGVYYHLHGDYGASKLYFLKARNGTVHLEHTSKKGGHYNSRSTSDDRAILFFQMGLGFGCSAIQPQGDLNEVFIYSTIHLMILNQYELNYYTKKGSVENINKCYNIFAALNADLKIGSFEADKQSSALEEGNPLLHITFQVLQAVFQREENDTSNLKLFANYHRTHHFFLDTLVLYLRLKSSTSVNQKQAYLQKCKDALNYKNPPDGGQILFIFILRELIEDCNSKGNKENLETYQHQLHQLELKFCSKMHMIESYLEASE